jgi:hypothetical protein
LYGPGTGPIGRMNGAARRHRPGVMRNQ